jgi:hypothetical protein
MWYRLNDLPDDSEWQMFGWFQPFRDPPPYPESSKGQDQSTKARTGCGDEEAETGNDCSLKDDSGTVQGEALPSYNDSVADKHLKV